MSYKAKDINLVRIRDRAACLKEGDHSKVQFLRVIGREGDEIVHEIVGERNAPKDICELTEMMRVWLKEEKIPDEKES